LNIEFYGKNFISKIAEAYTRENREAKILEQVGKGCIHIGAGKDVFSHM
jgi:hypothetical protein